MRAKSLVLVCILLTIATMALAETASWTPATGWTAIDPDTGATVTGSYTPEEMATMTFYLWAAQTGQTTAKFLTLRPGEYTVTGASASWSGNLKTLLGAKYKESWDFTVSQAYTDTDGVERESKQSGKFTYLFPNPPGRTPGEPTENKVAK